MRIFLLVAFVFIGVQASAQIMLEHTYDSASTYNWNSGALSQLMLINFESSGEQYVRINRAARTMDFYDLNHTPLKTNSLTGLPGSTFNQLGPILYLSEHLFNTDSQMEFMYVYQFSNSSGDGGIVTRIYNESLAVLFTDTSAWIIPNEYQHQGPIYSTSAGTKMILSCPNLPGMTGKAKVFSLPGSLTPGLALGNDLLMQDYSLSNPYPQPSSSFTHIDFTLPSGIDTGEIVFYDLNGKEIRRFRVDGGMERLVVSTADIAAGTYYYHLQTALERSGTKRMVVVR